MPGELKGTRNAETPRAPASGSVLAKTMPASPTMSRVIADFSPFSTQRSPLRTARVRIAAASEPQWGSVRQTQRTFFPAAIGGSQARLTASEANLPRMSPTKQQLSMP